MFVVCFLYFYQGKGSKRKGGKFKRSDGSFSDSSNSFIRQVGVVLIDYLPASSRAKWRLHHIITNHGYFITHLPSQGSLISPHNTQIHICPSILALAGALQQLMFFFRFCFFFAPCVRKTEKCQEKL